MQRCNIRESFATSKHIWEWENIALGQYTRGHAQRNDVQMQQGNVLSKQEGGCALDASRLPVSLTRQRLFLFSSGVCLADTVDSLQDG